MSAKIFRAKFVAPMDQPLIRDGAILVENDHILAVGAASTIHHPQATLRDLGEVILLPGLINAHTHLELSLTRFEPRGGASFVDWLDSVRQRNTSDPADAVREGIAQCHRFGVTTVGDITQQITETRQTLREIKDRPRVISFGEALGLAKRRARFELLLQEALDQHAASPTLRIGLSPHAPYTVDRLGFVQCLRAAKEHHLPLATHLAEHREERDFLESHAGCFRELWDRLGFWEEPVDTFRGSPIEFAHAIGLLQYPTLLAHVNYCDDDELELLARGNASVVYCPRTHQYFDHPPHRWREMLAAGVNVALGTDSCASSPDLNIVDEIRLLHELAPKVAVETLWQMITTRAAQVLQMHSEIGSIAAGKCAELVAFDVTSNDPLREILETSVLPNSRSWLD